MVSFSSVGSSHSSAMVFPEIAVKSSDTSKVVLLLTVRIDGT